MIFFLKQKVEKNQGDIDFNDMQATIGKNYLYANKSGGKGAFNKERIIKTKANDKYVSEPNTSHSSRINNAKDNASNHSQEFTKGVNKSLVPGIFFC